MKFLIAVILTLFFVPPFAAQSVTRLTKVSSVYDLAMDPGPCYGDQCGPIKVTLYRKRSTKLFQEITAGRLGKNWLSDSIQFIDINFDGIKDLFIFDGLTAPGGNGTDSYRIYLYSLRDRQFVFNQELSELSKEESFLLEPRYLRKKQIVTYARPGGGVFQNRWYRVTDNRPKMFREVISDATYKNGTRTLDTTRTLVNGRWIVRTKVTKGPLNQ